MPSGTFVPVTPAVVRWAVGQSGYSLQALAILVGVSPDTLQAWAEGKAKPKLGELRKLAAQLNRPLATFLLPSPPASSLPEVAFRSLPGGEPRPLYPVELLHLREAGRLQKVLSWISSELHLQVNPLPLITTSSEPTEAAAATRVRIKIRAERQRDWQSSSAALQGWRGALEDSGVFVMMFPMGDEACRGFSLWDEFAPLVAANTSWSAEARAFTLFHEYAHLLTRTPSACGEGTPQHGTRSDDPAERWCERFAAAVILPPADLRLYLAERGWRPGQFVDNFDIVRGAAKHFKASLRATTLSLIELGAASWGHYASLPGATDRAPDRGGGAGRTKPQIKRDQYGLRTFETFSLALRQDVLSGGDVLDYLDVSPQALSSTNIEHE